MESLFDMDIKGAEEDPIPYVRQLVLTNVSVEGLIIDTYENSLLDGPSNDWVFPTHNGEFVQFLYDDLRCWCGHK